MKKIIMTILLIGAFTASLQAQDVYKEGMKMAKEAAENEANDLETRKIATFKYDAIQYLGIMSSKHMPDSSAIMLDNQTLALYNYVNLFTQHYSRAAKKDKSMVIDLFKSVSLQHPRFEDDDKEWALAYIMNEGFLTQFSLNTDWVAALADVKKLLK